MRRKKRRVSGGSAACCGEFAVLWDLRWVRWTLRVALLTSTLKVRLVAAARSFTELLFWQRARKWSAEIFRRTKRGPFARDQRLVVQVNDSSESVMSNMAEGFGRGTQGEFLLFLGYALGSLDETQSHLCAAYDRACLSKDEFAGLFREGTAIRKLTVASIRSMVLMRGGREDAGEGAKLVAAGLGNVRARDGQAAAGDVADGW